LPCASRRDDSNMRYRLDFEFRTNERKTWIVRKMVLRTGSYVTTLYALKESRSIKTAIFIESYRFQRVILSQPRIQYGASMSMTIKYHTAVVCTKFSI
jgi:hypothetical protein